MRRLKMLLGVAALSLMLTGCTITFGDSKNGSTEATTTTEKTEPTTTEGEDDGKTTEDSSNGNTQAVNGNYVVVKSGVKFYVPMSRNLYINDEGNIYIDEENANWSLVLVVKDGNNDEFISSGEDVTSGVTSKGWTVTKDVTTVDINGKSYTYFDYENDTEDTTYMVVYAGATDSKRFGCNVVNVSGMADEDVIRDIDEMLHNVEETSDPDSTYDDIQDQADIPNGEAKESSTLTVGDTSVEFKVPAGFYSISSMDYDNGVDEFFQNDDKEMDIDIILEKKTMYEDAQGYIDYQIDRIKNGGKSYKDVNISNISQEKVNGRTFYVVFMNYTYDSNGESNQFSRAYAATDISDGTIVIYDACSIDGITLQISDINGFFDMK